MESSILASRTYSRKLMRKQIEMNMEIQKVESSEEMNFAESQEKRIIYELPSGAWLIPEPDDEEFYEDVHYGSGYLDEDWDDECDDSTDCTVDMNF